MNDKFEREFGVQSQMKKVVAGNREGYRLPKEYIEEQLDRFSDVSHHMSLNPEQRRAVMESGIDEICRQYNNAQTDRQRDAQAEYEYQKARRG